MRQKILMKILVIVTNPAVAATPVSNSWLSPPVRCNSDLDCESRNCVSGFCESGEVNECNSNFDCESNVCVDGKCATGGEGSGCRGHFDCDSGLCLDGRCQ